MTGLTTWCTKYEITKELNLERVIHAGVVSERTASWNALRKKVSTQWDTVSAVDEIAAQREKSWWKGLPLHTGHAKSRSEITEAAFLLRNRSIHFKIGFAIFFHNSYFTLCIYPVDTGGKKE
jgi:hypothetical protein